MKTVLEFTNLSPDERLDFISMQNIVAMGRAAPKIVAKILFAAGEAGDYEKGEMNSYAQKATGIELRRGLQGTYEMVKVLRGMNQGLVPLSEQEFDIAPKFGLIKLSSIIANSPEKVSQACKIITSRKGVTNQIRHLAEEK